MMGKIIAICSILNKVITRQKMINSIAKVEAKILSSLIKIGWQETKRSFGTLYPDKTFYVIRVRPITSSIGGLMMWVCKQLEYCESIGGGEWIPVIDFSFYENVFLEKDEIGKINPWEYFFEQPTMYSVRAVYNAKNVIIGNADCDCTIEEYDTIIDNEDKLRAYCEIYNKYVHINKRIEKKAQSIYSKIINPAWKVLGCVYRGTDYRNRKVVGEHRQPSLSETLEMAEILLEKWGCDHIFLATEDKGAVDVFQETFEDKLVLVEKERYPSNVAITQEYRFAREQDAYYKGEEYLIEIYALSCCNCLLSGRVGILMTALPMNNLRYEHKHIFDLGIYTEMDYESVSIEKEI